MKSYLIVIVAWALVMAGCAGSSSGGGSDSTDTPPPIPITAPTAPEPADPQWTFGTVTACTNLARDNYFTGTVMFYWIDVAANEDHYDLSMVGVNTTLPADSEIAESAPFTVFSSETNGREFTVRACNDAGCSDGLTLILVWSDLWPACR